MPGQIPVGTPITAQSPPSGPPQWAPLALGFRPFFLLGIISALLLMLVSIGGFSAGLWYDNYFTLQLWHAHEMVFGYAIAVIAGFLLTSVRNWTGLDTPTGNTLALLVLLWLAPRLLSFVTALPPIAFALLDCTFLPLLALVLGRLIMRAKQANNYPIPLLLLLLALCNAAVHLEVLGFAAGISSQALQIAVISIIALIAVVAGRVVPFFMQRSIGARPASYAWVEKLALPSVLLLALSIAAGHDWLIVFAALLNTGIHGARLIGWTDRSVLQHPMLWVLHAGYAWLVAGFLLFAITVLMHASTLLAVHAWTVGGIGMFTLGMMTRVTLGHTGRSIEALRWIPAAFLLMLLATLVRVIVPGINPAWLDAALLISAMCWISAFGIVALRYTSILLHPRVDGKPG